MTGDIAGHTLLLIRNAVILNSFIAQTPPPQLPDIEEIDLPDALPDPWKLYLWIGIGVLAFIAVAAVVISLILYLTREKKRVLTAEYVALKRLSDLEPRAAELSPNEFSIEISDVLKDFVQKRFNDPVRFETADEFFHRLTDSENVTITPQVRDQLAEFLQIAEEIKFGLPPDAAAQKHPLLEKARNIIEAQRQAVQEAAAQSTRKR